MERPIPCRYNSMKMIKFFSPFNFLVAKRVIDSYEIEISVYLCVLSFILFGFSYSVCPIISVCFTMNYIFSL